MGKCQVPAPRSSDLISITLGMQAQYSLPSFMMTSAALTTDRVTVRGLARCLRPWNTVATHIGRGHPAHEPQPAPLPTFSALTRAPTTIRPLVLLTIIIHLCFCRCRVLSPRIEPICWSDNQGNELAVAVYSVRPRLRNALEFLVSTPTHRLLPNALECDLESLVHYTSAGVNRE